MLNLAGLHWAWQDDIRDLKEIDEDDDDEEEQVFEKLRSASELEHFLEDTQQGLFNLLKQWQFEPQEVLFVLGGAEIQPCLILSAARAGLFGDDWIGFVGYIMRLVIDRHISE